MTTSSSTLGLTLYGTADGAALYSTWQNSMSGSVGSNMVKIDNFSGSASGSLTRLSGSASGSMATVTTLLNSVSGSLTALSACAVSIDGKFKKLYEFSGVGQADFDSIPQTYKHLVIIGTAAANKYINSMGIGCDFNGDANPSNYIDLAWYNSKMSSILSETIASVENDATVCFGYIPGSLPAGYGGPFFAIIPNYSISGGFYKTGLGISAYTIPTTSGMASISGGVWKNTDPITRLRIFGGYVGAQRYDFLAGTLISVYGWY
jgi:hypothetical protein